MIRSPFFPAALLAMVALAPMPATAQLSLQGPNRGQTPAPRAELFSAPNFQGQRLMLTATIADLGRIGFNDRAQSVRVIGTWTFCEDSQFDDHCLTLSGDEPNLAAIGLANSISSARLEQGRGGPEPVRPLPTQPPPSEDIAALEGSTATFFPQPSWRGRPIPACETGGRGGDCARVNADRFCRAEGFVASAYFHVRYARRGQILEDVLCLH